MSEIAENVAIMIDMLPESDKIFAQEIIKKLVLAWDPDFTKLTENEKCALESAEHGEFVDSKSINWDDLSKYA